MKNLFTIIIASLLGTFIPLILNKFGIDNPSKTVKQMCGYGSVLIPCLYSLYRLNANGVRIAMF